MSQVTCTLEIAQAANYNFDLAVQSFLRIWVSQYESKTLLRFDQSLEEYLTNNALRDFFLHSENPLKELLQSDVIARHLSRRADEVYFDEVSRDPLFAKAEQRIYNLAHRLSSERLHVPFRSVQPAKQTEPGDTANIASYPPDSENLRYNSGNHFTSRPANSNVFDENSKRFAMKGAGHLQVIFKRGYLEDRLQEIKEQMMAMHDTGNLGYQYFVICSRHSPKEGHFGASLVIIDPSTPHFPKRVLVCDTLVKDLPHHPRWWIHFVAEYTNVFGDAISEVIEDLSHPLQKVNVKGDQPYRHDWDCPYYVTSMTEALADLTTINPELVLKGCATDIHNEMKKLMQDYYEPDQSVKERQKIREINRLKRWNSGLSMIRDLLSDVTCNSLHEHK
ncbi:hypothetical protein INP83_10970 [Mucilaginibacter sp. 21P]|uniref:hypothetical protein n=1 Tax=Mucilaginibacter sp. 21P TaxID=2778902 RepID=UPI001C5793DC|nr:hypothetical protein [Mucilaginibacter sp. 21P]QXV63639.1 hypothetical protein INP83_10970 [Mucilaginibacter sp. 21P]